MFVRQDIPIQHQAVQAIHAALTLGQRVAIDGIPNIVLIGVRSQQHLLRVEKKLADNAIDHVAWEEPDYDFGLTALATVPLTQEQKEVFARYLLWQPIYAGSSEKEQPILVGRSDVQVIPGVPRSPVAQLVEHSSDHKSAEEVYVRAVPGEPVFDVLL